MNCLVYRCAKQDEMYLYLRSDMEPGELPEVLRKRTGMLTQVMELTLSAERKLARANVETVIEQLQAQGFYLQMPPNGLISQNLHFGD